MNERVTVNGAVFFVGWRLTPYPTYGPCGLPLIYSPCWLKLSVLEISKSPVALPLTGATALCDLVARLSAAQAGETAAS
ncbi:hypothetical protein FML65_04190 [Klebsiella pneumoniae]|nr:hypothetical protein [Klebsiella pneumoniae]QDC84671.1 hypothetical protein FIU12_13565 [Klebsiella pneumoniae]